MVSGEQGTREQEADADIWGIDPNMGVGGGGQVTWTGAQKLPPCPRWYLEPQAKTHGPFYRVSLLE